MTLLLLFIAGLCVGSFLGALTWRMERDISIAKGRSFCPHCKHVIAWYDNIPLLSFVLLGAKCRNCKKPISFREPAIEFFTGLSFVGIYTAMPYILPQVEWLTPYSYGASAFLLFLVAITVAIIVIDIEEQIIPDSLAFLAFIVSFFVLLFSPASDVWIRLLCAFSAASFLLFLNLLTRGRGMGLGDVKLALFPGLILGFPLTVVWLFISFVLGAVIGVVLLLMQRVAFRAKIAFGPFLLIGFWVMLLFGPLILKTFLPM